MLISIGRFGAVIAFTLFICSCRKNNDAPPAATSRPIFPRSTDTTTLTQRPVKLNINSFIGGYYEAVPPDYFSGNKKYPLLIFLHGGGQVGDGDKDLPLVLNDGVAKEITNRKFPAIFSVNGNNFSFIVLSPQFRGYPPDSVILSFLNYAMANYRVDSARIYLSGLSMGGILTTEMAGLHTSLFAAVVPISGETFTSEKDVFAANIARGGLAFWDFHNADDPSVPVSTAFDFISLIKKANPVVVPKLTIFPASGHDAWTQALSASYRENDMNIYEWMLQYKR